MRTVRLKLYRLQELNTNMQEQVITKEAERFEQQISGRLKGFSNPHELEAAKERLIKNRAEFLENGTRMIF